MADDGIEVAPPDVVRYVADSMRGLPREPTAAELVARQEWLEQCREAEERRRIQRHHDQLDAEAKAAAEERERQWRLEREAALAAEQHRQRVSRAIAERSQRNRETARIYERLNRAEQFRNHVVAEARRNAAIQQRQALMDDLDRTINPPTAPEPTTIIVEQQSEGSAELGSADFDPKLFARKPRSWW
jgi:hypothetical protein